MAAPPPAGSAAGSTAGPAFPGHPPAWSVSDLSLYKDQELSNLLIAYARANLVVPELLAAVEREMCKPGRLAGFSSQASSLLMVAGSAMAGSLGWVARAACKGLLVP